MRIRLRYLGDHEDLAHLRDEIDDVFESTAALVAEELSLKDVDVFASAELWRTGSKTPIHGFSMSTHELVLRINPKSQASAAFRQEFGAVLAHELHHCKRWSGPGYGSSLREAIVSEGLACDYEKKFRCGLPEYVRPISNEELVVLAGQVAPYLDRPTYDHALWFDGREGKRCLPYLGYSVGYQLIQNEIEKCGASAADLCMAPAARFWAAT